MEASRSELLKAMENALGDDLDLRSELEEKTRAARTLADGLYKYGEKLRAAERTIRNLEVEIEKLRRDLAEARTKP